MALLLLSFALLAGSACASPFRIVGGAPTTIDQYPSIVQVEFRGVATGLWSQSCAANILNPGNVLSAAHCFAGGFYSPDNRRIRAGTTDRNLGGSITYVEREYNHPSYGTLGLDGDICVVRLLTLLDYNPVILPGIIVAQGTRIPDGMPVVHAGWGATQQGGSASPVLLDVTIYTVNHEICAARYQTLETPGIVTENMICAGLLDVGGADACQGDSGGPLYYDDNQLGNLLLGIVSWGHGCANATFPGISTAVSSYSDWIVNTAI